MDTGAGAGAGAGAGTAGGGASSVFFFFAPKMNGKRVEPVPVAADTTRTPPATSATVVAVFWLLPQAAASLKKNPFVGRIVVTVAATSTAAAALRGRFDRTISWICFLGELRSDRRSCAKSSVEQRVSQVPSRSDFDTEAEGEASLRQDYALFYARLSIDEFASGVGCSFFFEIAAIRPDE
jgi:hypothetical protein